MIEGIRESLIAHAKARDVVAVDNVHAGAPCVAIGRVIVVGPTHITLAAARQETRVIPIAQVTSITALDVSPADRPTAPALPESGAVVHGVVEP